MEYVQQVRGDNATEDARTAPVGVITIDTDNFGLRIHDGSTPGGIRVLSEPQLTAYKQLEFSAVSVESTPGDFDASLGSKLASITAGGTYNLPALSGLEVGQRIAIIATTSGVTLGCDGSEKFNDKGSVSATLSLVQDELLTVAKYDATNWRVIGRY